jgi:hypothetical protein
MLKTLNYFILSFTEILFIKKLFKKFKYPSEKNIIE